MKVSKSLIRFFTFLILVVSSFSSFCFAKGPEKIIIGIDADMSSGSARAGESIKRGVLTAVDEINSKGGILGRQVEVVIKDHRGNPARGIDNIESFGEMKNLGAVIGGLHTPVALAELKAVHEKKIIFLIPWAAGTPVVANNYDPNFVFRVSVRDEYAGSFLINKGVKLGYKKPALVLEQTGWGRSNRKSMTKALGKLGLSPGGTFWFNWGVKDLKETFEAAIEKGCDVVIFVGNSPEGITALKSMGLIDQDKRLPIISHWGITGGNFFEKSRESLNKVDLKFLQTFSFIKPVYQDRYEKVFKILKQKFKDIKDPSDIFAPAGTAHAYDLVHLYKIAVNKAGTINSEEVRKSLENITDYKGLVKNYSPPFTKKRHDALNGSDFILAEYNKDGVIVPVIIKK